VYIILFVDEKVIYMRSVCVGLKASLVAGFTGIGPALDAQFP